VRRLFLILLALACGLALYGFAEARRDPQIVRYRVPIAGLDRPLRIVQLSDSHGGSLVMPARRLQRVVAQVNALRPDLVVLTGDYIYGYPPGWTDAEARAVLANKQIPAARDQHAESACAFGGVQEQSADLARSFQIGRQRQHIGAKGATELLALLGKRADPVAVEGEKLTHFGEDLTRPAHLAGRDIFEHQHEQLVHQRIGIGKPFEFGNLRAQRLDFRA